METHPRLCAAAVEFDIQRRHVSLEGQPRRGLTGAEGIIDCVVLLAHCKLSPDLDVFVLWKILRSPG